MCRTTTGTGWSDHVLYQYHGIQRRASGRSHNQMQRASYGAMFLHAGGDCMNAYWRQRAQRMGRGDLRVESVDILIFGRFYRYAAIDLPEIVIDHAVELVMSKHGDGLNFMMSQVRLPKQDMKKTWPGLGRSLQDLQDKVGRYAHKG